MVIRVLYALEGLSLSSDGFSQRLEKVSWDSVSLQGWWSVLLREIGLGSVSAKQGAAYLCCAWNWRVVHNMLSHALVRFEVWL